MQRGLVKIGVAACVLALAVGGMSLAQQAGGGQGGGRGRGGRGNFDPAQMAQFQQQRMDNLKEQLGVTDEAEWKVMQPRLEKVMQLSTQARAGMGRGMFGGGRGRGGQGGQGGDQGGQTPTRGSGPNGELTALDKAMAQLRTTLANQSASPDELNKALTAVRDARTKAQQDLKAAQADLKKLLKVRQEAVLVADGMLE